MDLIPGFSIGISFLQNQMRKWGRREYVEKGKYWTIKRLFGDRFDYVQPMVAIDCQSASLFVSNNNNNKHQYQHQNIGTSKWLFGVQFDFVQWCAVGYCHLIEYGILCDCRSKRWLYNDKHHPHHQRQCYYGHHHQHLLDVIGCGILCDCVSRRWWCYSPEQMVTARAQRNLSNGRCNGQNMNKQADKFFEPNLMESNRAENETIFWGVVEKCTCHRT